jgi:Questin oxidase-like
MNLASSSLGKRSAHEPEKTIRKDFHRGKTVQPIHQSKLYAVLAQSREDSVEFPLMLANHAPMVIIALDRLGASGRAIEKWYEMYHIRHNLTPVRGVPAPIDRGRWKEALGDRTREADYRDFFAGEVTKLGAVGAIRAYLPHLLQGVAGSATHPLMRLAYGIIAEDDNEIAVALGYWACCYLHLPEPTDAQPDTDDPAGIGWHRLHRRGVVRQARNGTFSGTAFAQLGRCRNFARWSTASQSGRRRPGLWRRRRSRFI